MATPNKRFLTNGNYSKRRLRTAKAIRRGVVSSADKHAVFIVPNMRVFAIRTGNGSVAADFLFQVLLIGYDVPGGYQVTGHRALNINHWHIYQFNNELDVYHR
jgi:hypothetical protein